jgi:hypothetical protein
MRLPPNDERWPRRKRHQSAPAEATDVSRILPSRQKMHCTHVAWMVCLLNGLISWVAATAVVSVPFVSWEYQLSSNSTLGQPERGNGVVLENDLNTVWVTTNRGNVHIIRNGVESIYIPPTKENVDTQCTSSISLYQDKSGLQYAVYAVVDVPFSSQDPITR